MREIKDITKEISLIFNSNLSSALKYDKVSEVLSNVYNSRTVSFLIYDSNSDSLVCQGFYLNNKNLDIKDSKLKKILMNINIYDFLKHKKLKISNCEDLYKDFLKNNSLLKEVNKIDFFKICSSFDEDYKIYNKYKNTIREEKHKINYDTVSSNYYKDLINKKFQQTEILLVDLSNLEKTQKKSCNILLEKLEIPIEQDSYYLAVPLYATERYFGLIRFLIPKSNSVIKNINQALSLSINDLEKLNYLSQIISLHIETSYYLDGYKKLSNIGKSVINNESLNKSCEKICEIVNCNGSLIRYSENKNDEIKIKGNSSTLNNYVRELDRFNDPKNPELNKFSQSLINLFNSDASIVAVNFNTKSRDFINIFRLDDNLEIKSVLQKIELLELKSEPYLTLLNNLGINQIAVVLVPDIINGYMVFTNTENRKFVSTDIEMLILAVKGLGQEIKHQQDTLRINQQQLEIAQTESMRNVVHQLGAPLHAIVGHLYNIIHNKVPEKIVSKRILYAFQMIKNSMRQLKEFQRILELDTQPITLKKPKKINLKKFLINKSIEYQAVTESKGIRIHVFSDDINPEEFINVDSALFEEVISIFLDNAVKYDYNSQDLLLYGIDYNKESIRTAGNILINYSKTDEGLQIKFTNWGATINNNEKEKVFEKYYRGENSKAFAPVGSGIGLFLAKKILEAMDSRISINSNNNKTTFIINLIYKNE